MADTIVQKAVHQFEERLEELRPMAEEIHEIEDALNRLRGRSDGPATPRSSRGGRRGRPRGNGTRRNEFLTLVQEQPGVKVSEAAKSLNVNPNYLYRIAGEAQKEGVIRKEGQGYFMVEEQSDATGDDNSGNDGDE